MKGSRWPLTVLVFLAPLIITCGLVHLLFQKSLLDYVPTASDEMYYWHESLDFKEVGFHGGYYAFEERSARPLFTHFDAHGPAFPVLNGFMARLLGWKYYSGIINNFIFLAAAMLFFLLRVCPAPNSLVKCLAVLSVSWPLLFYLPSTMQESLHQAAAIALAAIFFTLIEKKNEIGSFFWPGSIVFIGVMSLLRPTWGLFFLPLFLFLSQGKSRLFKTVFAFTSLLLMAAFFQLFVYWGAPFPHSFLIKLKQVWQVSAADAAWLFIGHAVNNLKLFILPDFQMMMNVIQRYQLLTVFSLSTALFLYHSWKRKSANDNTGRWEYFLLSYAVLSIILIYFLFFEVINWVDFRGMAPHLLFCVFLSIALNRKLWIVGLVVVSSLIISPVFLSSYQYWASPSFQYHPESLRRFQNEISPYIIYRKHPDAWCNTFLSYLTPWPFPYQLIALPAGIGLSSVFDTNRLEFPIRSKYLLLDEKGRANLEGRTSLKLLVSTEIGNVYLNQDAVCD